MKTPTILLFALLVGVSSASFDLGRYWIFTCKKGACEHAFQDTIDTKCSGLRQCKTVVDQHYPECSRCFDELVDKDNLEEIEGQKYLVCSDEEQVQSLGCELYCRVNWFPTGECRRLGVVPVCQCSDQGSVEQSNQPAATTTPESSSTTTPAPHEYWSLEYTFTGCRGSAFSLAVLQNGDLACGSYDQSIKIWDARTGELKRELDTFADKIAALPNGDLASASDDMAAIKIWDTTTGELKHDFPRRCESDNNNNMLAVLTNGDLASYCRTKVIIWASETGALKHELAGHELDVVLVKALPNGKLATGSFDTTIRIWDAVSGSLVVTLPGHYTQSTSFALLPNGDLASGSSDGSIKIWDLETGQEKQSLSEPTYDRVTSLVPLPNGGLASGSWDHTVKVWDLATGQLKHNLTSHTGWVNKLLVLPNGDLASASNDRTLMIWDSATGELKDTLKGHKSSVNDAVILPNGDLASASIDGTVRIWTRRVDF